MEEVTIFAHYPNKLLGRYVAGANNFNFMKLAKQNGCAYCGMDFFAEGDDGYDNWENWHGDHVISQNICVELGIEIAWYDDFSNIAPACRTCNSLDTRYRPSFRVKKPETLDEFFNLRNKVFAERKLRVLKRREKRNRKRIADMKTYLGRPR